MRADLCDVPLDAWWAEGRPLVAAKGRGVVVLTRVADVDVVLRTYRRGGALRRVMPDAFRSPERAFRELAALAALRASGVPAVEPVAAVARRRGLLWDLRLATVLVDGALPLPAFAARRPAMRRMAAREAGRVVRAAFEAGLVHPDLHPDNLVARVSGERVDVVLLDLDRASVGRPASHAERDAMLLRMARYLLRHRDALPVRPTPVDLVGFLAGLGVGRGDRRRLMRRLAPALSRQAARRNLPAPATPRERAPAHGI